MGTGVSAWAKAWGGSWGRSWGYAPTAAQFHPVSRWQDIAPGVAARIEPVYVPEIHAHAVAPYNVRPVAAAAWHAVLPVSFGIVRPFGLQREHPPLRLERSAPRLELTRSLSLTRSRSKQ